MPSQVPRIHTDVLLPQLTGPHDIHIIPREALHINITENLDVNSFLWAEGTFYCSQTMCTSESTSESYSPGEPGILSSSARISANLVSIVLFRESKFFARARWDSIEVSTMVSSTVSSKKQCNGACKFLAPLQTEQFPRSVETKCLRRQRTCRCRRIVTYLACDCKALPGIVLADCNLPAGGAAVKCHARRSFTPA